MSKSNKPCSNTIPRYDLMRDLTEHKSDAYDQKKFKSIHDYNNYLETNGYDDARTKFLTSELANRCVPDKNKIVVSNRYFEDDFESIPDPNNFVPYDKYAMLNLLSTDNKPNYNFKNTTGEKDMTSYSEV